MNAQFTRAFVSDHAPRSGRGYGPPGVLLRSRNSESDRLVRSPAVAGLFYPEEPRRLGQEVRSLLASVKPTSKVAARAIIAPHAGYRYSGSVAAAAFVEIAHAQTKPAVVFLLGPPHRVGVRQMALPKARVLRTPLGDVPLHREICQQLLASGEVEESLEAHAMEHSLEVALPFLQTLFGEELSVVPILVGGARPEMVASILDRYFDYPGAIFVVSSDLSHFLDYGAARARDADTVRRIVSLSAPDLQGEDACGCSAINGLIVLAQRRALVPRLLRLESSGDRGGEASRVVGYGALGFWQESEGR